MLDRKLAYIALHLLISIIYGLFLALVTLESPSAHMFLQALAKYFLMTSMNLLAIPLVVAWAPPWYAIYVTVATWILQFLLYYQIVKADLAEDKI